MCYYSGIDENTIRIITARLPPAGFDPQNRELPFQAMKKVCAMERPVFPVQTMQQPDVLQTGYRWLLVPPWFQSRAQLKSQKIWAANIRIEEAGEKRLYIPLIEKRRCIIYFSHFYEWKHEGNKKIPYCLVLEDESPMMLPGLYSSCVLDSGEYHSFALCTMEAKGIMRDIHNSKLRQPVVTDSSGAKAWLDGKIPFGDARRMVMASEQSPLFKASVISLQP